MVNFTGQNVKICALFALYTIFSKKKDGTNQLPTAGFDWIALKVIFQGRKGLNFLLFSNFDTYCPFIQNLFGNFFLYFGMKPPQEGDNELGREWYDIITLKVIAKVRKSRI